MPEFRKICAAQGCGRPANPGAGKCGECLAAAGVVRRIRAKDAQRLYHSLMWQRLRRAVLLDQPVCMDCGRMPSTDADHIDGDTTHNERSNLQGLCRGCHSRKTAIHDGGFGR